MSGIQFDDPNDPMRRRVLRVANVSAAEKGASVAVRRLTLLPCANNDDAATPSGHFLAFGLAGLRVTERMHSSTLFRKQYHWTRMGASPQPSIVASSILESHRDVRARRFPPVDARFLALITPAAASLSVDSPHCRANVTSLDMVVRLQASTNAAQAGDGSSLDSSSSSECVSSLRKFYVAQDSATITSEISSDLSGELLWEEEQDPLQLARKRKRVAQEQQQQLRAADKDGANAGVVPGDEAAVDDDAPAKRFKAEESRPIEVSSTASSGMPVPIPAARAPHDLLEKTAVVIERHRGATTAVDDLWKEIARLVDDFKSVKKQSKEAQAEWARVCRSAVLRRLHELGYVVDGNTVTIPR